MCGNSDWSHLEEECCRFRPKALIDIRVVESQAAICDERDAASVQRGVAYLVNTLAWAWSRLAGLIYQRSKNAIITVIDPVRDPLGYQSQTHSDNDHQDRDGRSHEDANLLPVLDGNHDGHRDRSAWWDCGVEMSEEHGGLNMYRRARQWGTTARKLSTTTHPMIGGACMHRPDMANVVMEVLPSHKQVLGSS